MSEAQPPTAPRASTIDVFICDRGRNAPKCKCGGRGIAKCSFALRGARAGESCGVVLCRHCAVFVDDKALCAPHARMAGVVC